MDERGTGTVEWVGLAAAVTLLLAGVATSMRGGPGLELGDGVGTRLAAAVTSSDSDEHRPGSRRIVHERRIAGGSDPQRVPRDELRLAPIVDPHAWRQHDLRHPLHLPGSTAVLDSKACLLCSALEWRHASRAGASKGGHVGGTLDLTAEARLELAAADLGVRVGQHAGPLTASEQGRVRGVVGGSAEARARLKLAPGSQDLELSGTAMAGASARAEGRFGAQLLGVSVIQAGRVEGWAGAGAKGAVGVHREGGTFGWRIGWGAALGLGGAAEWSGSVDVSRVPSRYRELASAVLDAGVRSAAFVLPVHALPHLNR
jgi:hypothetical protein